MTRVRVDVPERGGEQGPDEEGAEGDAQDSGQDQAFVRQARADDVQSRGCSLVDILGEEESEVCGPGFERQLPGLLPGSLAPACPRPPRNLD